MLLRCVALQQKTSTTVTMGAGAARTWLILCSLAVTACHFDKGGYNIGEPIDAVTMPTDVALGFDAPTPFDAPTTSIDSGPADGAVSDAATSPSDAAETPADAPPSDAAILPPDAPPPACEQTCTGCCELDQCFLGTSELRCGNDGVSCTECPAEYICQEGDCRVDPDALWRLIAVGATVNPLTADGFLWDSNGSPPDPYLEIETIINGVPAASSTSWTGNTLTPQWNEIVLSAVHAQSVRVVRYRMLDLDSGQPDFIGECILTLPETAFTGETVTVSCPRNVTQNQAGFELQLRLEPAED